MSCVQNGCTHIEPQIPGRGDSSPNGQHDQLDIWLKFSLSSVTMQQIWLKGWRIFINGRSV